MSGLQFLARLAARLPHTSLDEFDLRFTKTMAMYALYCYGCVLYIRVTLDADSWIYVLITYCVRFPNSESSTEETPVAVGIPVLWPFVAIFLLCHTVDSHDWIRNRPLYLYYPRLQGDQEKQPL